jgi:hypothetical protein
MDYYRWTEETADKLRRRKFESLDLPALIEEVEDLGRKERSALESRLAVLLAHLLKWDRQPMKGSRSWGATISLQRLRIERLLDESPSLRPVVTQILPAAYREAVLLAVRDTGLDREPFPSECPYTAECILSGD